MASPRNYDHASVRISFPEHISETHGGISSILHTHCLGVVCAFGGFWPTLMTDHPP